VGEKYLTLDLFLTGNDQADNENMYVGYDNDTYRSTNSTVANFFPPKRDVRGVVHYAFGSSHPGSFNVVFCDGSVRRITYNIDATSYQLMGGRADGQVLSNQP